MTMAPRRHPDRPRPGAARERAIPIALIAEMDLAAIPIPSQVQQDRGFRASWSEHRAADPRLARSHPPRPRGEIPIAHGPEPRLPPLEAFGRRPSARSEPARTGRHPKPFTLADIGVPPKTGYSFHHDDATRRDGCICTSPIPATSSRPENVPRARGVTMLASATVTCMVRLSEGCVSDGKQRIDRWASIGP